MSQESRDEELQRYIERLERAVNWLAGSFILISAILVAALAYVSGRCP